ncbi:MAG: hypothetical protein OHK0029_12310 [Armatimonadaceae bacterium]
MRHQNTGRYHRPLLAALLFCGALALLWDSVPLRGAEDRLTAFSCGRGDFACREVPPTETEKAVFAGARVFKAAVRWRSEMFLITVVDGTRNRHAVHDPLYCFRGAGWNIVAEQELPVVGGQSRWVRLRKPFPDTASRETGETEAVFFFSDGKRRHSRPLRYWGETVVRRVSVGLSGPEPVLVILQPLLTEPSRPPDWQHILYGFTALQGI